ncbi:MAG: TIGR01777 family oxidoreductase [Myxococcota bacterium]
MTQTFAVSGASGLVGSALVANLEQKGYVVRRLVRQGASSEAQIAYAPSRGTIDVDAFAGVDVVIHLAGAGIADRRWSNSYKDQIRSSRVDSTRLIARAMTSCSGGPQTLVSASAIGFYGPCGDEMVDEERAAGSGFLADVCRAWEAETEAVSAGGGRVVRARIGIVLSPAGGALRRMLPAFKFGVGGRLGDGRQYMSWITLQDTVRALVHLATHAECSGPVNVVAPNPVTNQEFTSTLGRVLGRPAVMNVPSAALNLMFGEMARPLLLQGNRVCPKRLQELGFDWHHQELEPALRSLGI